jgi:hypothetical protein
MDSAECELETGAQSKFLTRPIHLHGDGVFANLDAVDANLAGAYGYFPLFA